MIFNASEKFSVNLPTVVCCFLCRYPTTLELRVKNVAHENFKNQFFTSTRDEYETWNILGNNLSRDLIEKQQKLHLQTNTNFLMAKTL